MVLTALFTMHAEQQSGARELMERFKQQAVVKAAATHALKPNQLYKQALYVTGLKEDELRHFEIDMIFATAQQNPKSYVFDFDYRYLLDQLANPSKIIQAMQWINKQTNNKELKEIADNLQNLLERKSKSSSPSLVIVQ